METILSKIVGSWSDSGLIDKTDEDIYLYGLDLLIFTILNLVVILITSVFINKFIESIILLLAVIPLQSYGGGYHAKTHLRCFMIMYLCWWGVIHIIPFISSFAALIMVLISISTIYILAPVPHENVIMSAKHRIKLRKLVRITSVSIGFLSIVLILFSQEFYIRAGVVLSTGLGLVAISMLVAHFMNLAKKSKS